MKSARDLIAARIQALGLGPYFEILEDRIRGKNGSLDHLQGHAELQRGKHQEPWRTSTWRGSRRHKRFPSARFATFGPTIRKPGSEMWFSWNPRHDTDPVDKFFRGSEPRENAITRQRQLVR